MTFKKTVGSLSFVLATTVSSIALAQGLGVGANVGIGSAPVSANVQAGGQTSVGAQTGTPPDSGMNKRSETALGSDTKGTAGAASVGTTQAIEASGKSTVGMGLDTAAAAQANAQDAPLKIVKARKAVHVKTSAKAKGDLDTSTKLKAQDPN